MTDEPMTADESIPPDEDGDAIESPVAWFLHEDDEPSLRKQAGWTERHLGLSDAFYARFLRVPESSFRDWKVGRAELPEERQDALRGVRHTLLYLLHFTRQDEEGARAFLERHVPVKAPPSRRDDYFPPWNGSCLKSYLEEGGPDVLPGVEYWLEGFWAGDPFVF
jgi:hypothetical protein